MKYKIALIVSILLFVDVEAQWNDRIDDTFAELDSLLTLRFSDAEAGKPLVGGKVEISGIGTFTTDSVGRVRFKVPAEDGYYKARFTKPGYINTNFEIEITAGTVIYNHLSISRTLPPGYLRIVLDWSREPPDLDAHLIKKGGYHISFRDSKTGADGKVLFDRDDRNGFGPETITCKEIDQDARYTFFVHDYSNRGKHSSTALSDSRATVKVYGRDQLIYLFEVPTDAKGVFWEVFQIKNGIFKPVNKIRNRQPEL